MCKEIHDIPNLKHDEIPPEEGWDEVADWELLGLDPDTPQDEIDREWENQM